MLRPVVFLLCFIGFYYIHFSVGHFEQQSVLEHSSHTNRYYYTKMKDNSNSYIANRETIVFLLCVCQVMITGIIIKCSFI